MTPDGSLDWFQILTIDGSPFYLMTSWHHTPNNTTSAKKQIFEQNMNTKNNQINKFGILLH